MHPERNAGAPASGNFFSPLGASGVRVKPLPWSTVTRRRILGHKPSPALTPSQSKRCAKTCAAICDVTPLYKAIFNYND
jgi:hypothetical protein